MIKNDRFFELTLKMLQITLKFEVNSLELRPKPVKSIKEDTQTLSLVYNLYHQRSGKQKTVEFLLKSVSAIMSLIRCFHFLLN